MKASKVYRKAAELVANGHNSFSCTAVSAACEQESIGKSRSLRRRYGDLFVGESPMPFGPSQNADSRKHRILALLLMSAIAASEE